jgi:CheY-like chemotaxis protein
VFNADPTTLRKIGSRMPRVLILDPHPAAAKLLSDMMRELGAQQVTIHSKTLRALELVATVEPALIFVEYHGQDFNGPEFTRLLRRSTLGERRVPVIMCTSEATVESIKEARDSGVHEFLRKPFTSKDLYRRVENVLLKPRDWIEAKMYVGPDRRRFNSGEYAGPKKRTGEKAPEAKATNAA